MAKKKGTAKKAVAKKAPAKKAPAKKAPAKKAASSSSDRSYISKAPVRRLMKNEGAGLVSDDAIKILITQLEAHAIETTKKAMNIVKDEKRKRLTAADITMATRL